METLKKIATCLWKWQSIIAMYVFSCAFQVIAHSISIEPLSDGSPSIDIYVLGILDSFVLMFMSYAIFKADIKWNTWPMKGEAE